MKCSYQDCKGKVVPNSGDVCQQHADAEERISWLEAENRKLRAMVDRQADDAGLWFMAETAAEGYLQQELRKLHAAIEAAVRLDGGGRG